MKAVSMMIEAGSVISWKKYSLLKEIWAWLRRKELPHNRFTIIPNRTELILINDTGATFNAVIYEPIRKYSRLESNKLSVLCKDCNYNNEDWVDTANIINLVRPNTFAGPTTLNTCRYYKKVELHEKLDEYIY